MQQITITPETPLKLLKAHAIERIQTTASLQQYEPILIARYFSKRHPAAKRHAYLTWLLTAPDEHIEQHARLLLHADSYGGKPA